MSHFLVNPPIRDDRDYYRFDDYIVERVLSGQSILAIGLRRSGKTSFLYRIQRSAEEDGRQALFLDPDDFFASENPDQAVSKAINDIKNHKDAIILLDEVEVFMGKSRYILTKLLSVCMKRIVVITCAPIFLTKLETYSKVVQKFIETCYKHQIGPLNDDEAFALISQKKRGHSSSISKSNINEILQSGERMPIILQALGAKFADNIDITISLAGFGNFVLTGLSNQSRDALVLAAHGKTPSLEKHEMQLLIALGALKKQNVGKKKKIIIYSLIMEECIRHCSNLSSVRGSNKALYIPSKENWIKHARILHLSDLHFGPKYIEDDKPVNIQLKKLITAVEKFEIIPDFIAITGDLSWSGNPKELKIAERFLEGLSRWLEDCHGFNQMEARNRFLIVPGNHESSWSLSSDLKSKDKRDYIIFSSAPYANFVNRFYKGLVFWDLESPCLVRHFGNYAISFITISTAHLITKEEPEGRFGDKLCEEICKLLESTNVQKSRFRIGMMHHNLRSFHKDGRHIKDIEEAGIEFAKCRHGFDLILHGHVHHGEVDIFQPRGHHPPLNYSAVGSFGVQADHRPGDSKRGRVPNEFAVVELQTNGTGRRFQTQYFIHTHTTSGGWEWEIGRKSDAVPL
jgi:hypothetical protein